MRGKFHTRLALGSARCGGHVDDGGIPMIPFGIGGPSDDMKKAPSFLL